MRIIEQVKKELKEHSSKEKAAHLSRFFKTGKGQYAEGDIFIGVTAPELGVIGKKYFNDISIEETRDLLRTEIHEFRTAALFMMILKYKKAKDESIKKGIYDMYIGSLRHINNWDLVDMSAGKIIGDYLYNYKKDYSILYDFAKSTHLWTQRIAMISTFYFIRMNQFDDTLKIAELLMDHGHDLIHKAVGWLLREVGKRDFKREYDFLLKYYKKMPRTMLRYAIEKFDEDLRIDFLKGLI